MSALHRKKLMKWLDAHDFERLPLTASGHQHFEHRDTHVVITVAAHGRGELSKKHVGMLVRQLEQAGFTREHVKADLLN